MQYLRSDTQQEHPLTGTTLERPTHWELHHEHGIFSWLHPTHARFHDDQLHADIDWSARPHRKGRRVRVHAKPGEHRIVRCFPRLWGFEWGNISWWVAQWFTWGSVVWCVNGCFSFIPLSDMNTQDYVIGYTALVGGTLFEIGAYCMVLEALNQGHAVRFGYEVKNLLEKEATHLHPVHGGGHYKSDLKRQRGFRLRGEPGKSGAEGSQGDQQWRWWGYRFHNLGYLASLITMLGATIFWIATITGVPGVLPDESVHYLEWDFLYWLPQCLGGSCFIFAPLLLMLEVQHSWWRIRPFNVGWQVAFWNFVGGVGFFLSGLFGFWAYPAGTKQHYGTAFSTFWGSWAFLIGSYIQLVEMLN